jgi:hypothetical protein
VYAATLGVVCDIAFSYFHAMKHISILVPEGAILGSLEGTRQLFTQVLRNALLHLSNKQLQSADAYGIPGDELSLVDAITFIIDRESYCIGQIGLYRRLLGYEPMKYQ